VRSLNAAGSSLFYWPMRWVVHTVQRFDFQIQINIDLCCWTLLIYYDESMKKKKQISPVVEEHVGIGRDQSNVFFISSVKQLWHIKSQFFIPAGSPMHCCWSRWLFIVKPRFWFYGNPIRGTPCRDDAEKMRTRNCRRLKIKSRQKDKRASEG